MAEKDQILCPLPQSNGGTSAQFDGDIATTETRNVPRNKRRMKSLVYFVAFVVLLTAIILIFAQTVVKVRTPIFRVRSASFETFDVGTIANPYFSLSMKIELGVKNDNFGDYKFDKNTTVHFFYDGSPVGYVVLLGSKARRRATERFNAVVDLSTSSSRNNNTKLAKDLSSGVITLECQSKLSGKVELMLIMLKKEKKKSANMDCTLTVGVPDKAVRHITCK